MKKMLIKLEEYLCDKSIEIVTQTNFSTYQRIKLESVLKLQNLIKKFI